MAAPKGNKFAEGNSGRPKAIPTPDEFMSLFQDFKQWNEEQKISVPVVTKFGKESLEYTPPLTWAGFDAWLYSKGIITDTEKYRQNEGGNYLEFRGVVRVINNIMYSNKFNGAAVGLYNQNIIARDLGLTDKKELEHSGNINTQIFRMPDGTEIKF